MVIITVENIVIKPDLGVDPTKELSLGFIDRVNPENLKNIFKVLIFHMKN